MEKKALSFSRLKKQYKSIVGRIEEPLIKEKLKFRTHCFENAETGIILLKDSLEVFSTTKTLKNALADFLKGHSRIEVCRKHGVDKRELDSLLHLLFQKLKLKADSQKNLKQENALDRLVMHVSNDCNLKCRYCYAGGGTYGNSKLFMGKETASATLEWFCREFDNINKVQFFGGEPLLKTEMIGFLCEEFTRKHLQGELKEVPQFSIVTNGTLGSEKVFRLLKKFNIKMTISLDGPEPLNDYLRGKGTYKKICQFINQLERLGIEYGFEGTYTSFHLESGITLTDLMDFFYQRFNQQEVHIPPVSLQEGHSLSLRIDDEAELYRDAIEYSLTKSENNGSSILSFASRLLNVYVNQQPEQHYCPAGISTLSVDSQGNLYPCFMFTGNQDLCLGNVHQEPLLRNDLAKKITHVICQTSKSNNPECQECWASPFCFGCIGGDYIRSGGSFKKTSCKVMKAMTEGFLSAATTFVNKEEHV